MPFPVRKVQTQEEKVIDYQYIRNLKNREVRKKRFKSTVSEKIVRVLLFTVLAAELLYLGVQGYLLLQNSKIFVLQSISITGTKKTHPDQIQEAVAKKYQNVLTADLADIKYTLESQPWISSAVVWREWPNGLRIEIVERQPAAMILAEALYLVDSEGKAIDTLENNPEYASLPVITGIPSISDEGRIRSALRFLNEIAADPAILEQLSEIHYYDRYSTIVYLKGISFGLLVSKDGILPMIRKFRSHTEFIKRNFPAQKMIDLRFREQIILKDSYREQL